MPTDPEAPADDETFDVEAHRAAVVEELAAAPDVRLVETREAATDGNPEHGSNVPGDELADVPEED